MNIPPIHYTRLPCDIHQGGSTAQFLTYGKEQLTETQYVESIRSALIRKAKSKPTVIARRLGSLIGVTMEKLNSDPYILDAVITAFTYIERELEK